MKKYISFIIFFTIIEFLTSFFLSSNLGKYFFSNPDDNFSELNSGYEIDFGSSFKGKLYFSDNRPTIYYTRPTWRQLTNVYYCDSALCILNKDFIKSYKIEDIAIKTDTYNKTNEVLLKTLDYYDVFNEYDLSYSGWKMRLTNNQYKNDKYYDIILFPQKDRNMDVCIWSTNTKRNWYKFETIDISKSRWIKENVDDNNGWSISENDYKSIWDNPEIVNFEATTGDILKLQLKISHNSSVLFFIDGEATTPISETITKVSDNEQYYNYDFLIDTTGEHSITIVHINKLSELSRLKRLDKTLLPYSFINKVEISSFINEGRTLDTTNLKNDDYIIERFECPDGHIEEKSMKYEIRNDK